MFLRQIFDPHLAQYAYLIGCQRTGEAVVVDPERDIDRYKAIAAEEGLRITAVAETHLHADFVSGAREFASDPSVKIRVSAEGGDYWRSVWTDGMPNVALLRDGDTFKVGNILFRAIHTPGHTPEHMVYLVTDLGGGADEPMAMLSGDLLFVGSAGRPDLLEQAAGIAGTQEAGARRLYASLRKISGLPEYLQILPGHGAGSACGKALGAIPSSTLGYEARFNPSYRLALHGGEAEFVAHILAGQPEPPGYFAEMKRVNRAGPAPLGAGPRPRAQSIAEISGRKDDPRFVILDTRSREEFVAGHLPKSLFAPKEKFSDFAGSYVAPGDEIALVVNDADEVEGHVRRLARIGFDRVAGYLLAREAAAAGALKPLPVARFADIPRLLAESRHTLLDVRKSAEFAEGHLAGALNLAHTRLRPRLAEIPKDKPLVVSCASGLRAVGASAYLARQGFAVTGVNEPFDRAPAGLMA